MLSQVYGLDRRSLALFRVALGLLLMYNFVIFKIIPYNEFFSPEHGFLGNTYKQVFKSPQFWSMFDYFESDLTLKIAFGCTLIIYLFYTIGLFTKFSNVLAYFLFFSLQQRYYPAEMGWEKYMNVLLFISIFLPTAHFFSIDSVRNSKKFKLDNFEYRGAFAWVAIAQIACIYFFSGICKTGELWLNGKAVAYAVNDIFQSTSFSKILLNNPFLSSSLTYYTIFFESFLIVLMFMPFKNKQWRYVVMLLILSFHWGVSLFLNVGHFKYASLCAVIMLLPDSFWTKLMYKWKKLENYLKNGIDQKSISVLTQNKYLTFIKSLAAVYLVAFMFHSGFRLLCERESIIGNTLNAIGVDSFLNQTKFYPSHWMVASFFNQSWFFYSPNPPTLTGYYVVVGIKDGVDYQISVIDSSFHLNKSAENYQMDDLDMFFQEKLAIYSMQLNNFETTTQMFQELNRMWLMRQYEKWYIQHSSIQLDYIELTYYYFNRQSVMNANLMKKHSVEKAFFEW